LGIETDTDLSLLHGEPRIAALAAHASEVAETRQKATITATSN
jgi:hypothetical protein